jgi:signal transduction histidine kinase
MNPISDFLSVLPWLLTLVALACALGLSWRLSSTIRAYRACLEICAQARVGETNVTRILRLFAHELQGLALTLRGHADHLVADRHANAPIVGGVAAQLGGLADELEHHLMPAGERRSLSCETISLAGLVSDAVDTVAIAISPGRRNWRVPSDSATDLLVWADLRALRQVLARVLGESVRSSGQNDWIEINWLSGPDGIVLLIEDEGAGPARPGVPAPMEARGVADSRGIGLRLSLARTLIQAHGGTLDVEAIARIGTRVTLTLPPERLRGPAQVQDTRARPRSLAEL